MIQLIFGSRNSDAQSRGDTGSAAMSDTSSRIHPCRRRADGFIGSVCQSLCGELRFHADFWHTMVSRSLDHPASELDLELGLID